MEMRREVSAMELDTETILDALNDFEHKPSPNVPPVLENLLVWIAKTGDTLYPWTKLKPVFICKLEKVIQEYVQVNQEEVPLAPNVENVNFDDMRHRLVKAINTFAYAPFTIQRLCELITDPKRYYKRSDKFMRGIEKNIMVVSTVSPDGKRQLRSSDFEKPVAMMNGIDHANSNNLEHHKSSKTETNDKNMSNTYSNNLNVSETVVDKVNQVEQTSSIGGSKETEATAAVQLTQTIGGKSSKDRDKPDNKEELTKTAAESESKHTDTQSNINPPSTCKSIESNQSQASEKLEDSDQSEASKKSEDSSQSETLTKSEESDQSQASTKPEESNKSETSINTSSVSGTNEQLDNEMDTS